MNLKETLGEGPLKELYVFYGELSSDAAHPSAASLDRHVIETDGGITLIGSPHAGTDEVFETLEFG